MIQDTSLPSTLYLATSADGHCGGWGIPQGIAPDGDIDYSHLREASTFWAVSIPGLSAWCGSESQNPVLELRQPTQPHKFPLSGVNHIGVQVKVSKPKNLSDFYYLLKSFSRYTIKICPKAFDRLISCLLSEYWILSRMNDATISFICHPNSSSASKAALMHLNSFKSRLCMSSIQRPYQRQLSQECSPSLHYCRGPIPSEKKL